MTGRVGTGTLIGHPSSTDSMAWAGYPGSLSTGPAPQTIYGLSLSFAATVKGDRAPCGRANLDRSW